MLRIALILILLLLPASSKADVLLQSSNMTYLGAFTVPGTYYPYTGGTFGFGDEGGVSALYNPGGNSGNGSLIIGGPVVYNRYVAELSIPSPLYTGSSLTTLNQDAYVAHFLKGPDCRGGNQCGPNFYDITEGNWKLMASGGTDYGAGQVYLGGLYLNGSSILGSVYAQYDTDHVQILSHFTHSSDITASSYSGMYGMNLGAFAISGSGSGDAPGVISGAMCPIPAAYQAQLGGKALATAMPPNMSIMGRTSMGPSATAFDPDNLGTVNTIPGSTNAYMLVGYPNGHNTLVNWASDSNQYGSAADFVGGVVFPSGTRSVLFIGRHGSGTYCYGPATYDINLNGTLSPDGVHPWCYDPDSAPNAEGQHMYPYVTYVWAYDVGDSSGNNTSGNTVASMPSTATGHEGATNRNNLTAVKLGYVNPWDLYPYAVWTISRQFYSFDNVCGVGFDSTTNKLYLVSPRANSILPVVEVYQLNSGGTPTPTYKLINGKSIGGKSLKVQ